MHSLVIVALTLLPIDMATDMKSPLDGKPGCVRGADKAKGQKGFGAKRLGDLPPASQYKAVWRTEDGCPKPLIVRRNIAPAETGR